jgi:hypothetical protein
MTDREMTDEIGVCDESMGDCVCNSDVEQVAQEDVPAEDAPVADEGAPVLEDTHDGTMNCKDCDGNCNGCDIENDPTRIEYVERKMPSPNGGSIGVAAISVPTIVSSKISFLMDTAKRFRGSRTDFLKTLLGDPNLTESDRQMVLAFDAGMALMSTLMIHVAPEYTVAAAVIAKDKMSKETMGVGDSIIEDYEKAVKDDAISEFVGKYFKGANNPKKNGSGKNFSGRR